MGVRLYAVLRLRPKPALPIGLRGERVRILKSAGLSIAVADIRAALEPTPDNFLDFDRVVRALAGVSDAILPARFGVMADDVKMLKTEIADRAGALAAALDLVAGRVQMTVRVPPSGGPVSAAAPRSAAKGPGSKYLQTIAAAANPPVLTRLREPLVNLVRAERIEPGRELTTVYHLIDSGDIAAYRASAKGFRVSGPFPPYAFVPGIDRAISPGHDEEENQSATRPAKGPRATGSRTR